MDKELLKLKELLENVSGAYDSFVNCILEDCNYYKSKNHNIRQQLIEFIEKHPDAKASDVLDYETNLIGVPYGDDNGKWYRWGKEITEEEAQRIVDEEYADE